MGQKGRRGKCEVEGRKGGERTVWKVGGRRVEEERAEDRRAERGREFYHFIKRRREE